MLFYIHGYQGACPLKLMNFGIFKYRQKTKKCQILVDVNKVHSL